MGVHKLTWVFCWPRSEADRMRWGFLPDNAGEVGEEKACPRGRSPELVPILQIHKEVVMLLRHSTGGVGASVES